MTQQSYEVSNKIQSYVLERLQKKNHNVKFKCLQILKVVIYHR
jgi:hypothetical protein